MANFIVNEVLCVLHNNFGKIPRSNIVSVFSEFYTEDEISGSKKILLDAADSLSPKPDELKNIRKMRVGDGRKARETEDLLQLYSLLDVRKHSLPTFYAADTSRVPTLRDFDVCKVAADITQIKEKLSDVNGNVSALLEWSVSASVAQSSRQQPVPSQTSSPSGDNATAENAYGRFPSTSSFRDVLQGGIGGSRVQEGSTVRNDWVQVVNNKTRRKIVGANKSVHIGANTEVKSQLTTSKPKAWHLFVGKLHKDVNEEEVKEFLAEKNIEVTEVRKLEAKQTWQEAFSAFKVCVNIKFKDVVMNEDVWPEEADVRDWVFNPKKPSQI